MSLYKDSINKKYTYGDNFIMIENNYFYDRK